LVVGEHLLHHCAGLTDAQRASLVADFELGKQTITLQLRLKLAPWKVLPLRLLGLGHHKPHDARRCAMACLAQYHRVPAERRPHLHNISRVLLARQGNGGLREDIVSFVRGTDMAALPRLRIYADGFLFIPNIEIGIERLHAYVSQRIKIAHHHSPAYVSVTLRKHEILDCHARLGPDFCEACGVIQNKLGVIRELGLEYHPSFADFRLADGARRSGHILDHTVPFGLINKVVYRCDLPTQYNEVPPVRMLLRPGGGGGGGGGGGAPGGGGGRGRRGPCAPAPGAGPAVPPGGHGGPPPPPGGGPSAIGAPPPGNNDGIGANPNWVKSGAPK
jgi:hypothetical protein